MFRPKLIHVGVILAVVIGVASYYFYPSHTAELTQATAKSYSSSQYGIAFLYPTYYRLTTDTVGKVAPIHFKITLGDSVAANGAEALPKQGESSPQITIDIYENDGQYASAQDFVDKNPESNAKLATSGMAPLTVGSDSAVTYTTTGLYENRSVVVVRKGYAYLFTVAGGNEKSGLSADFDAILRTVILSDMSVSK